MCKRRVGIIFGGRSEEHRISCESASYVMKALSADKYDSLYIGITRDGKWKRFNGPVEAVAECRWLEYTEDFSIDALPREAEFVMPVLHGPYGEDGTVQGLLELLDIPYGGCGVLASAIAMDKALFEDVLKAKGLPVCRYISFRREEYEEDPEGHLKKIEEALGFPCFVKPANMGSSVGISKVYAASKLGEAVEEAFIYDRKIIAEEFIDARELEVTLSGNYIIEASFPGEIIPEDDFYGYEAKYSGKAEATVLRIPAEVSGHICKRLQRLAVDTFKAIGGEGFGRVDFFLSRSDGHIYINEVNTIPGMTGRSMFPLLMQKEGRTPGEIIERIIDLGYERYHTKNRR